MDHKNPCAAVVALSLVFCPLASIGQSVYVPDTNLRAALNEWVPGCVDGSGYLDPQLPAVQDQEELTLHVRWSPADLTGIDALSDLTQLSVQGQCLSIGGFWTACDEHTISVPALPASLVELSISSGIYGSLPSWPISLSSLSLWSAHGTASLEPLPATLSSFEVIQCYDLAVVPELPSGMEELTLALYTDIGLPDLPGSITNLVLHMGGGEVPSLPPMLTHLDLYGFDSQVLEEPWPPGLVELSLYRMDSLTILPASYPAGLNKLVLYDNADLDVIPEPLPAGLEVLELTDLPVEEIPELPAALQGLTLQGMPNIHCLPLLPGDLEELYIDYYEIIMQSPTGVACLPNIPPGMQLFAGWNVGLVAGPQSLCTVLNSACDLLNPVATGAVYQDQNGNGARDDGEPGYPFAHILAQPGAITYGVQPSGDFQSPMPIGQYTLTAVPDNPYVVSILPASHDASFANATDVDADNDFGVVLQPDIRDVRIDLNGPWSRMGFEDVGIITYDNFGSTVVDGSITFQLDVHQSWVGSTPAPTTINGNTLTWSFSNLQVGESRSITLTVYTDPSVALETELQHTATIDPVVGDETPLNNTAVCNTQVWGSCDPNDKRVEPTILSPMEVAAGQEVIYTIRFQNTGTYQADRVLITDTLSARLQWSTMRLINSSHPCGWILAGSGALRFTFDPIFLPDSTSDEPNSHGYVRFAMKPVSDLMLGESVSNAASIYFDFNEPVITDEAVFTVETSTAIDPATVLSSGVEMWPNPVEEVLYIERAAGQRIEVLDVTGRVVLREQGAGVLHGIDVRALASGGYTVRVQGNGTRVFIRR